MFCRDVYPRLVGTLTLYVGDQPAGEELAQEALLRAISRWETVRRLEFPEGWVHRVAINLANSWFRRLRVSRRHTVAVEREATIPDVELKLGVRRAISGLPKRQKAAVLLRYYLDLPGDQAAELLGVSPAAFRQLTHRALANLGPILEDPEGASLDQEAGCAR